MVGSPSPPGRRAALNMDLETTDWSDAAFFGFVWENEGRDLRLSLEHGSLPVAGLLCRWASGLRVDLSWRALVGDGGDSIRRGGPLLTTTGRIARGATGWSVVVEFGSDGALAFECDEIVPLAASARSPGP